MQMARLAETVRSNWYEISKAEAEYALAKEIERNATVSFENELITNAELLGARLAALAAALEVERSKFAFESALGDLEDTVGEKLSTR
jgi:hypothetical protein